MKMILRYLKIEKFKGGDEIGHVTKTHSTLKRVSECNSRNSQTAL